MNKSAASAASLDYVKFQAVIKSAVSAASLDYVRFQAVIKSAVSAAYLAEAALAADLITTFFRNLWSR